MFFSDSVVIGAHNFYAEIGPQLTDVQGKYLGGLLMWFALQVSFDIKPVVSSRCPAKLPCRGGPVL